MKEIIKLLRDAEQEISIAESACYCSFIKSCETCKDHLRRESIMQGLSAHLADLEANETTK